MNRLEIKLTGDTVENIRIMAPHLTEREQYIVLGMMLAHTGTEEGKKNKTK